MMDALTQHNEIIAEHCDRSRQTRALRPDRALIFVNQHVVELNDIYLRASSGYAGGPAGLTPATDQFAGRLTLSLAVGRQPAAGPDQALTIDAAPKKL